MKKTLAAIVFLTCFVCNLAAQTQPTTPIAAPTPPIEAMPPTCPKVEIKTSPAPVRDGAIVKFTANSIGGDAKVVPMYDWSISAGMVKSGQGTPAIEVDTTGAGVERTIVATLLIGGYPPDCISSANGSLTVAGPAHKFLEFGDLAEEAQTQKLDSFIPRVPDGDLAYIIAYGGRNTPRGYASSNLKKLRAYLVKMGMPYERVVSIDGGYREQPTFELWIVPQGAESPKPTPTVDAKTIVFPKAVPAVKKP